MLMLDSEMMEGQLLAGFLETLRGLPEAQAEVEWGPAAGWPGSGI